MSTKQRNYEEIFSYLKSLNFHFLNSWVIECVNYCNSANPNLSLEAIKDVVKEQWLLVNLRNIKVPSLPPNLAACNKTVLTGKYVVQVETMIDSSRSCYSQFQEILHVNLDNIDTTEQTQEFNICNVRPSRCLVFTITDGVQELKAMEHKPITKISLNDPELVPGFKMLIIGPVECRKGMIMLQEENVQLCGGEVDTLTLTNNLRSLLLNRLNLNEEDYPANDFQTGNQGDENVQIDNRGSNETDRLITSVPLDNTHIETLLSQNDEIFLEVPLEPETLQEELSDKHMGPPSTSFSNVTDLSTVNKNRVRNDAFKDFNFSHSNSDIVADEVFVTMFGKHTLPPEEKTTPSPKKMSLSPSGETCSLFLKEAVNNQKTKNRRKLVNGKSNGSENQVENHRNNYSNVMSKEHIQTSLASYFTGGSNKSNVIKRTVETASTPDKPKQLCNFNNKPFVYLKQIMSKKSSREHIHTIKGIILTLKTKITLTKDEYSLMGTITDGSSSIDANFASDIIENFLEYSPCEMQAMIKMKQVNPAMSDRIQGAFRKAQEKFISLNALMQIKFFPNGRPPLILSLEEVTRDHLNALKLRCKPSL